ncbi:MAG: M14 family zinc carboxypeptidase [bacterium]|nr:M14 family zinc carboxypeptidase [bacterium]
MRCSLALGYALLLNVFVAAAQQELVQLPPLYVARVYYPTEAALQDLVARYDVHEFNDREEGYVLVTASPRTLAQLEAEGWRVSIDAERSAELTHPQARFMRRPAGFAPQEFYGAYKTAQEIVAHLNALTAAYPHLARLVDYGDAYCKSVGGTVTPGGQTQELHDLLALCITATNTPGPKPVFFLMAAIHAREITTPELAIRFAHWLLEGYGHDPDATWLVNEQETWIVPLVNPEAHWLVSLGTLPPFNGPPFMQRKNAHQDRCSAWPPDDWAQYGIDLNRNHSFHWGTVGISTAPCSLVYCGTAPASEPEVAALQALVTNLIPDQRGPLLTDPAPSNTTGLLISLHSYGRYVLWPWGDTAAPAPNANELRAIGLKFARYNRYRAGQSSTSLYSTSGDSTDWAYGELGIPAFTFEVGTSFMPAYSAIDADQWPTNRGALIYAAKIARAPYMLVAGPDALALELVPTPSNMVVVSAVIDERGTGSNLVAAAECALLPFTHPQVVPIPMSAADGAFDSVYEPVVGYVDSTMLGGPEALVYVRGQDALGNWGPMSAVFVGDIPEPGHVLLCGVCLLLMRTFQRRHAVCRKSMQTAKAHVPLYKLSPARLEPAKAD